MPSNQKYFREYVFAVNCPGEQGRLVLMPFFMDAVQNSEVEFVESFQQLC